jgi:DNA-directed RNA polymerase beta' subunit/DNA-directed RNA polymerase subunit K/omega
MSRMAAPQPTPVRRVRAEEHWDIIKRTAEEQAALQPAVAVKMLINIMSWKQMKQMSVVEVVSKEENGTPGCLNDLRMGSTSSAERCSTCQDVDCLGHPGLIRFTPKRPPSVSMPQPGTPAVGYGPPGSGLLLIAEHHLVARGDYVVGYATGQGGYRPLTLAEQAVGQSLPRPFHLVPAKPPRQINIIPHPKHIRAIIRFMVCTCPDCGRLLVTDELYAEWGLNNLSTNRSIAVLEEKCKKVTFCPHLEVHHLIVYLPDGTQTRGPLYYPAIDREYNAPESETRGEITFKYAKHSEHKANTAYQTIPTIKVFEHLCRIGRDNPADLIKLGLADKHGTLRARPEDYLFRGLVVTPNNTRAVTIDSNGTRSNDINYLYKGVLAVANQKNVSLKELYNAVRDLFDNKSGKRAGATPVNPLTRFVQGKTGLIREGMMGKRTEHTGRTVIEPGPMQRFTQVTIPGAMADIATKPVLVNALNIGHVRELIRSGRVITIYSRREGRREDLGHREYASPKVDDILERKDHTTLTVTPDNREALLDLWDQGGFLTYIRNGRRRPCPRTLVRIVPGDRVDMRIQEGDMILLNRQPSLHLQSAVAFRVLIAPKKLTMGLHPSAGPGFAADFDGDEMTIHNVQDLYAEAELLVIYNSARCITTIENGDPIAAPIMDTLSAVAYLTAPGVVITRHTMADCLARLTNDNDVYTLASRLAKWGVPVLTGAALFSALLPEDLYYRKGDVLVVDGVLLSGIVTKEHIGGRARSIVQELLTEGYGTERTSQFITDATIVIEHWSSHNRAMSVGPMDFLSPDQLGEEVHPSDVQELEKAVTGWSNLQNDEVDAAVARQRQVFLATIRQIPKYLVHVDRDEQLRRLYQQAALAVETIVGLYGALDDEQVAAEHQTTRRHKAQAALALWRDISHSLLTSGGRRQRLVHGIISRAKHQVKALSIESAQETDMERKQRQQQIARVLEGVEANSTTLTKQELPAGNFAAHAAMAGAKGNIGNYAKSSLHGQTFSGGKSLPPLTMTQGTRASPYAPPNDTDPEHRGLSERGFMAGLTMKNILPHAVETRRALADVGLNSSESGASGRGLIKWAENRESSADGSIRNTVTGHITSPIYGGDGYSPAQLKPVTTEGETKLVPWDLRSLVTKANLQVGWAPAHLAKRLDIQVQYGSFLQGLSRGLEDSADLLLRQLARNQIANDLSRYGLLVAQRRADVYQAAAQSGIPVPPTPESPGEWVFSLAEWSAAAPTVLSLLERLLQQVVQPSPVRVTAPSLQRYASTRRTPPVLDRYELAYLLGWRTEQIANGDSPYLAPSEYRPEDTVRPLNIALIELHKGKLDGHQIRRTLTDGTHEDWLVGELQKIDLPDIQREVDLSDRLQREV